MDAEDPVGDGVGQDLHKAVSLVIDLGPGICGERELADLISHAGGLQLLLGLTDPKPLLDECR